MRVAGLKAIDTVVESSAVLIKSKNPTNPELIEKIKRRIMGWTGMNLYKRVIIANFYRCTKVCYLQIQH